MGIGAGPFYWNKTAGKFPMQDGKPVLITQEEFEECCCVACFCDEDLLDGYGDPVNPIDRFTDDFDFTDSASYSGPLIFKWKNALDYLTAPAEWDDAYAQFNHSSWGSYAGGQAEAWLFRDGHGTYYPSLGGLLNIACVGEGEHAFLWEGGDVVFNGPAWFIELRIDGGTAWGQFWENHYYKIFSRDCTDIGIPRPQIITEWDDVILTDEDPANHPEFNMFVTAEIELVDNPLPP